MIETVVILLHGYKVLDVRRSVNRLRPYLEALGCLVEVHPYGYWPFPWQITKVNPQVALEVAERVRYWNEKGYRVCIACHSNGGAIARSVCLVHQVPVDRILAIHPALRKDLHISETAEKVIVVHNKGDRAVVAGKVLGWISRWLIPNSWVFRPWGDMGQDGYQGPLENHGNIDSGSDRYPITCHGHSQEFRKGRAEFWLRHLSQVLIRWPRGLYR